MKKIWMGVIIILVISSCKQKKQIVGLAGNSGRQLDTVEQTPMSLNGYDQTTAMELIQDFPDDPGSYTKDNRTNIWFSNKYLHDVRKLIDSTYNGMRVYDGIRIYYVKNDDNKYNFIIVPTKDNGLDPKHPNKRWHKDYYETKAFLYTKEVIGRVDHGTYGGASLYKDTPGCPVVDTCGVDVHHIPCDLAEKWVKSYSNVTFNSWAEWYEWKLIDHLDDEINNPKGDENGIRIYFAKQGINGRYCFVIVATKKDKFRRQDSFECFSKIDKSDDKGELCPTSCDPPK